MASRAAGRSSARAMYRLDSEIIASSRRVSGWTGTGAIRPCSTARDSHSASRLEPWRATSSSQASGASTAGPSPSTMRWKSFLGAPSAYAEVLGAKGLARFEAVVDKRFAALPRLSPGDETDTPSRHTRFLPTALKEQLAALRGPDDLVEVISHDLSTPYQFLRAAKVLAAADRVEEALGRLARGREAFGRQDYRLADLEADLHQRAGRP